MGLSSRIAKRFRARLSFRHGSRRRTYSRSNGLSESMVPRICPDKQHLGPLLRPGPLLHEQLLRSSLRRLRRFFFRVDQLQPRPWSFLALLRFGAPVALLVQKTGEAQFSPSQTHARIPFKGIRYCENNKISFFFSIPWKNVGGDLEIYFREPLVDLSMVSRFMAIGVFSYGCA